MIGRAMKRWLSAIGDSMAYGSFILLMAVFLLGWMLYGWH